MAPVSKRLGGRIWYKHIIYVVVAILMDTEKNLDRHVMEKEKNSSVFRIILTNYKNYYYLNTKHYVLHWVVYCMLDLQLCILNLAFFMGVVIKHDRI